MNKKRRLKKIEKEYKEIFESFSIPKGKDADRIDELWEEYKDLVLNNRGEEKST